MIITDFNITQVIVGMFCWPGRTVIASEFPSQWLAPAGIGFLWPATFFIAPRDNGLDAIVWTPNGRGLQSPLWRAQSQIKVSHIASSVEDKILLPFIRLGFGLIAQGELLSAV